MSNRIADLTIRLNSESAKFSRDIESAKYLLRGYGREASNAARENTDFSRSFASSAGSVSAGSRLMAAGLTSVATGIGAIALVAVVGVAAIKSIADAQVPLARELESLSYRSGIATDKLQSLSYATAGYNISADKAADISKDVNDKLGDFIATGGGEFADFFKNIAPKVDLTAEALSKLSGPDVLVAVKKAMDDTNTSAKEQVFYLESIANDASMLTPLLANNGAKLKEMDQRFKSLNITMTSSEITKFKEYGQDVDDMKGSFNALVREAITPFVDGLGDAAKYLADIFSSGRRNLLQNRIHDAHEEMVELKDEITALEDKIANGPKYGGVGFIDALLGNTDKEANLASLKAEYDEIRTELGEYQGKMAELDGKPVKSPEVALGSSQVSKTISPGKSQADLEAMGVARLAAFDMQYANEREQLILQHEQRLADIDTLQVSEAELKRLGYDNLAALRDEYSQRNKAFFEEEQQALIERQNQKEQREIDALKRKEDREKRSAEKIAKERVDTEARFDKQLLGIKTQVASQTAGLIADSAKEGSAIQKAAFLFQQVLAAKQIMIQGEVAAMAALSMPPVGLGPIAGAGMATSIRIMSGISAGMVLGQSIAGFKELGGGVNAGSSYIVGERGAEVFTPGAGGQITSNSNLKRLGGGGVIVNVHEAPAGTSVEKSYVDEQQVIDIYLKDMNSDGPMAQANQQILGVERKGY
ncbi:hypothetical protein [Shewanella surugensis]|uniref:Bacteriophage tail tape measure C-terminal domain-containing protein n=1 Tax=Shewanella surugensis TaxID=212020 RepID=A0ABT0LA57_9GAMM|nr:hypothetical protein [Shewanella surugensis]MCL1124240.1 hypothetical protein [Shewanella surugensis]